MLSADQTVLFVEDDAELRAATVQRLQLEDIAVRACASADAALPLIDADFAGIVVSDIRMPGTDGLQLFARVRAIDPELPVILVTGHADVAMALDALRAGAFDFLTKPFAADMLIAAVRRALTQRRLVVDNRALRAAAASAQRAEGPLIGDSVAMTQLRATIHQLAAADIDILVEGETGTGKELVALQLHRQGPRRGKPFIAVNCGALPAALAESELFGHAADSVPQTRLSRVGQIEASSGGTLLLDEIDSMPLPLQAKLLRVLEEREVQPIGSDRPRAVDLHVIATSKRPLEEAVAAGDFRSDLFYRLDVVRLRVPALRQRGSDVLLLFATFVEEARARFDRPAPPLTDRVRRHLRTHDWPGNVRELRNFAWQTVLGTASAVPDGATGDALAERVRAFEKEVIEAALQAHRGKVVAVLRELDVPRKTFYDKVGRLGIDLARFRNGKAANADPGTRGAPIDRGPAT